MSAQLLRPDDKHWRRLICSCDWPATMVAIPSDGIVDPKSKAEFDSWGIDIQGALRPGRVDRVPKSWRKKTELYMGHLTVMQG